MKNLISRVDIIINAASADMFSEKQYAHSQHATQQMAGTSKVHETTEKVSFNLNGEITSITVNHLEDPCMDTMEPVVLSIKTKAGRIMETPADLLDVFQQIFGVTKASLKTPDGVAKGLWQLLRKSVLSANVDGGDFQSLEKDLRKLTGQVRHSNLDKDVKGELLRLVYASQKTGALRKLYAELKNLQKEAWS